MSGGSSCKVPRPAAPWETHVCLLLLRCHTTCIAGVCEHLAHVPDTKTFASSSLPFRFFTPHHGGQALPQPRVQFLYHPHHRLQSSVAMLSQTTPALISSFGPVQSTAALMAVGIQEPLLKQDGSGEEKDKPVDRTCPASGRVGKRCAVEAFKMPEKTFKSHPGGQDHLKLAAQSECPALLFLAYHMGCDLDGRIAGTVKALGIEMPEYGELFADVHALVRKVKEDHKSQHVVFVAWCLIITASVFAAFTWFMFTPTMAAAIFVA